jgi:hypothetical protein
MVGWRASRQLDGRVKLFGKSSAAAHAVVPIERSVATAGAFIARATPKSLVL